MLNKKKKNSLEEQPVYENKANQEFPIVGIGASAGGLEAFKVLLERLPVDSGLAFVIIQHLAAGQKSMLTSILSRFTKMPVLQVTDGMPVKPNHVYVIPPGATMTLEHGILKLIPKGKSLKPIDAFLSSLAAECKTQSIGIVLSGTGTDGTLGLKVIKVEGGITFAQNPESAQYPDMPQSAILAEAVDFVLPPDQIAEELVKIAKHPQLVRAEIEKAIETKPRKETGFGAIFVMLKSAFGIDFSHYKETFIQRRLKRRMVINNVEKLRDYIDYLRKHPNELQAFFGDMLIGVTSFFREPNTFSMLKENVFPEIVKDRSGKQPIRVWIAGCSTGEEAYSFAITLIEFLQEQGITDIPVQVFGTDANGKNIDKARQGIYPKTIEADVSENLLKKYFSSFNGNYQITKFIRDKCVFAKQDLTTDPPFSNMDIISCRNMLIYFDSDLQARVVSVLHYALKPDGFLILGESESVGKLTALFEPIGKKRILFKKKKAQPHATFGFEAATVHYGKAALKAPEKKNPVVLIRDEVDRILVNDHVPAALLVNSNLDIIVSRGNVTPYILLEPGLASLNLAKMVRKELRSEVQTLIYKAKKEKKPVKAEALRFEQDARPKTINIQVAPIKMLQYEEPFFLVLFEDVSSAVARLQQATDLMTTPGGRENAKENQIRELREELDSTKQSLQLIIETQEATNEELKAAMEEVQSSNEELLSTNEELETAKEELQSSNEELTTLNDELKNRNEALARLNSDLTNLITNVDSAVVMLDRNLKIRRFSPSAEKILDLIPSHIGLPITSVRLGIAVPDLEKAALSVITNQSAVTTEIRDAQGRIYEMRVRPYLTEDNRIDGAVLSFIDVAELKKRESEVQIEKEKYRTLAENSPDIIARVHKNLRTLYVNSAVGKIIGISPEEFVGKTSEEIGLPKKFVATWNNVLHNVIQTGREEKGELEFSASKRTRIFQYVIVPEFSVNGVVETALSLFKDVTADREAQEAARASLDRYRSFVEVSGELGWIANADGEVVEDIPSWRRFTGQTYDEVKGWGWSEAVHPDDLEHTKKVWKEAVKTKSTYEVEYRIRRHDGVYRLFEVLGVPMFRDDGSVLEWVGTCIDVTGSRNMEHELTVSLEKSRGRESEISALLNASRAVLQNKEFQDSARAIFDACKGLLGATAGYVALLSNDEKENDVLFLDSGELPCTVDPSLPMPIRGLRAEVYNFRKVVVENDFSQSKWKEFMPEGHVQLKNVLFAPLIIEQRTVGVIGLANKPGGFSKRDAEMAMAFGELASIALSNGRMLEMLEVNEKQLTTYSEHLEVLVEERTKKLKDSERLAAIGATAGMVGHDIRNPLQTITGEVFLAKGELDNLPDGDVKECLKESLDIIGEQAIYVNKIVSDLQDFSRPLTPKLEEVGFEKILQAVLSSLNIPQSNPAQSVQVQYFISPTFPKLKVDPSYLQRILQNLVNNALQAMPKGGKLQINATYEKDKVFIMVEDTGEGIPLEVRGKLFTPLMTTKSKGQGFGLAVIKRLTEALNGKVSFESEVGRGTKFIVELPV